MTSVSYQKHHIEKIKIATIQNLEIRHWSKNDELASSITEKWLNLNDLNNQNNLACFNGIMLYCYYLFRTVTIKALNKLNSKNISDYKSLIRT